MCHSRGEGAETRESVADRFSQTLEAVEHALPERRSVCPEAVVDRALFGGQLRLDEIGDGARRQREDELSWMALRAADRRSYVPIPSGG